MKTNQGILILLCLILLIPILDLLHPGFPITHDGQDHIARIANFYQNLQNGIVIPRWAANLNWGFGHPILMFLYPLSSYLASIFHFLGLSLIDSTKLIFAFGMFFSGITMYLWLSSFWSKSSSFLGAIFYVFAPYRFVELYVRGDIGENLAFVFIPLVLLYIHKLAEKKSVRDIALGAISFGLLILAHNAISLMFLPFILLFTLYKALFYAKNKYTFFLNVGFLLILGFGLSAFFWVPGLLEGKYTLRNIVTFGVYSSRFVSLNQLLYGPWSYDGSGFFTVQLGILHWAFFIFSIVSLPFLWFKKQKKFAFVFLLVIYSFIAIVFMLPVTNFIWRKFILLQNFQFPWRFLAITVFTTSVLTGFVLEQLPKDSKKIISIIFVILIIFLSKEYWHAKAYAIKPESFFTGIYNGTTDTGESAPIWSVRFMEKIADKKVVIINGKGDLSVRKRTGTTHFYKVNILSDQARILDNTLFFPGWRVFLDGKEIVVQFQDQAHRGLITFFVPQGWHSILVEFTETKLRMIADTISLVSIIFLLFLLGKVKKIFL